MDCLTMKRITLTLSTLLAAGLMAQPALAQQEPRDSRTYFTARLYDRPAPQQLSSEDRAYYDAVFSAIEGGQWGRADELLAQRDRGLLHDVAKAEYYLAANSPRVELGQILAWLETGAELPQAPQLVRLGQTRGLEREPSLPYARDFVAQREVPRRTRPRSVDDGTMPSDIRAQILEHITNDDPTGARILLDGVDASLSPEARAEWRQRIAWSYFIENMDAQALAMAQTVPAGRGEWVAEGEWTAGLASWRLGDCETSSAAFQRAAQQAINPTLRAASLFWASRAAMRCRQPGLSEDLLQDAARLDETLYGMLALEQLGRALPDRVESADFTDEDWRAIGGNQNTRVAVALSEIGRDVLASQVLLHQARIGNPRDYDAYSRLARDLGFPRTQIYMALYAPPGGEADPASHYPAPKIAPPGGWEIDPGLAFAHILQESVFRADAVSPANAQGLMQITPPTLRQHAGCVGRPAGSIDPFDPGTNLVLGQCNLQMVARNPATGGRLPQIMAAYNAGLTPVSRWVSEVNDQNDPLLYMEAIPYWETRGYVSIVMRNYWMYERQANSPSPTRVALAQNAWPMFPGTSSNDGRVYMSGGQ
ncbi:lytic transglycosylase domain-containing protein [Aurantiacibacter poecillastricola]|uniref:lytic transglycosylase domain-containing protein n=1 Tax=Aurantiacibacter poecillastricola TaxID=3064385 RepID=UPI00273D880C|nr:lytic transglycosylase domain-containing protein [Aurantiacibacter sp. 219JJ12-13]MDP5262180.1 transglycosylase SLT domain-containing protein [Aurantiacibacter sp. 219JJ12-13]